MATHLNIGDFSRMTFLSVKALRHYHEVGLLVPASIDAESGYLKYSISQVPTAQVIRRLRDLGMPLEDLRVVLLAPDLHTRNATIIAHLQRMEQQLEQTQLAVASLRKLIESTPTTIPVDYAVYPAADIIAIRAHLAMEEVDSWRLAAFKELRSVLETSGLRRAGADGALYSGELLENEYGSIVAFIPVEGSPRSSGRVKKSHLPASEVAITIHSGSFDNLDQSYAALGNFVAERAIGVDGAIREKYLIGPLETDDESHFRTEICWPIFRTTTDSQP